MNRLPPRLVYRIGTTLVVVAIVTGCAAAPAASPPTSPTATSIVPTASPPPAVVPLSPTASVAVDPTIANPTPTADVTPVLAPEATPPSTSVGGSPPYLDNRSDGAEVIRSYYNAINRNEYDRAYSYWESSAAQQALASYSQFKQGYANTKSVQLTVGQVYGDAGAGQRYNAVPVALVATQTDGTTQAYAGCYTLHLADPVIQDQPPFNPWQIQSAQIQKVAAGVNPVDQLPSACLSNGQPPGQPVPVQPTVSPTDIGKSRYLDDRTTPEDVLRSYYNAINRNEYDRAYSYWEPAAAANQIPPYDQFKQGYANTASVDLTLGNSAVGVGAGNLYFRVPTEVVAQTTTGQTQTFVGCYTLHLGQPAIQDLPPFQPIQIQSASLKQVANGTDVTTLLSQACPPP